MADGGVDLLLLDVRLPDGSGLELASELSEGGARPRILVMSASVLPTQREVALASGADAFLAKPYAMADLHRLLSDLLRADRS